MCRLLQLWWKRISIPLPPFLKEQRGNAPAMPPFSGVPVQGRTQGGVLGLTPPLELDILQKFYYLRKEINCF